MERERALHNWKRLVDSLEKASLAPSDSRVFHVPSSLAAHDQITSHESDITKILEVADEIEPQNSDVALILYEHAFAKSQSLDPNSEGRGVLQFKTGLMSYIKQKRASERGTPVHPKGDDRYRMDSMYTLQKFYESYRREHLDLILEDSLATADIKKLEERKLKRQKVLTTLRVLKDVVEMYAKKHPEEAERVLTPQFKNLLKADAYYLEALIPYNILPLEGPGESTLFALPELKAAREVLEVPHLVIRDGFQRPQHRQQDVFDALEVAFGFQPDNIKNQREHLVLLLANAQSRSINPNKVEDEDKRSIVDFLCPRILDNYENWCLYIREQCVYERAGESSLTLKVALMALYLCIWGEAANVRFLPECICYIYHNMANELRAMLTGGHIEPSQSLRIANGGKKELRFLEEVIQPIYEALAVEAKKSNGGKEPHSRWRNYDDFNEFFWSRSCFHKLKWPIKDYSGSSFFSKEKGQGKSSGKTSFVEHRTFLHLYHSFVRVWILLVMMLQALGIIAFNDNFDFNTVKILLSLGPTYFVMKFIESVLDIVLMVGAYFSSRRSAIIRIFVHFFWYGGCTVGFSYLYIKTWQDPTGFFLKVYLWALGSYAGVKLFLSLIQHLRSVQQEVRKTSKSRVVETLKWLYQERFYVGRGLSETLRYYIRYVLFWMLVLACKFTVSYYFQIRPLVNPTKVIVARTAKAVYAWFDIVSAGNHNALSVFFLWAPIVLIYLLDISIWYTLVSAILGLIIGTKDHLGEIRTLDMLRIRFNSFPQSFVKNLQHDKPAKQKDMEGTKIQIEYAHIFAPFWNKIIFCLREEDYITNNERDHLIMPSEKSNMNLVQWPLFLLISKLSLALNLVVDKRESPDDLLERLENDEYMRFALAEAVEGVHNLLDSMLVGSGKKFFQLFYEDLKDKAQSRNKDFKDKEQSMNLDVFFTYFRLDGINGVYMATSNLLKAIPSSQGRDDLNVRTALQNLYESALQFLSEDLRRERYHEYSKKEPEYLFDNVKLSPPPLKEEQLRRLKLLFLSKESAATIPKNREARRRLEFFTNSLFMRMPGAPSVRAMKSFSILTPYYKEIVMFSIDDLQKENEDGITTLFYLQKIFPDEWDNFQKRVGYTETVLTQMLRKPKAEYKEQEHQLEMELRLWASYRGQTLARTVRGMMYYRKALLLQASLEALEMGQGLDEVKKNAIKEALPDLKFTYVVSCQLYGQQKANPDNEDIIKANDIQQLLKMNKSLRVAYIDIVDSSKIKGGKKDYYSKLIKSDDAGKDQVIYSIKLPGNPILGEGKPENQNHAVIFTRGDGLQTIDMNQDNYFEEALKIRNLLEEFEGEHGKHKPTILGVREHVFTGSVSSLAWFMSNQERSFVTLGQRVLARPLKVRMHYGHPDVFDRLFHVTRGGISKASKTINVSEDIFAGFNSTLRQGQVTHHEYIQVGKGRDVGLNQIALFEAKVSSGNGEQLLSRDVYRLGQLFDFFRMLSFYFTSVGYYVCTMMTTLVVFIFLYGKAYLALSGLGQYFMTLALNTQNTALMAALNTQFVYQIGFFNAVPMLMVFILEEGFFQAIVSFITMQLQLSPIFFTFSLGTRTHYFGRTVLHGGAKYRETGRGFVVQHIKFAENYRLYSQSHFVKALEIMMLLLVILAYGYDNSTTSYIVFSIFCWFLAFSWLFAPYIFNPSGFEWQKTVQDFDDWTNWLLYRGGVGVKGNDSWEAWWDEGQEHIRTPVGRVSETILSLRFFLFQYGVVYHLHVVKHDTRPSIYGFSWLVLMGLILIFLVFSFSPRSSVNYQMILRFVQGMVFIIVLVGLVLVVVLTAVTLGDIFASLLAFVPTGWAVLSIGIAWKPVVKQMGLWRSIRAIAWYYDAVMGAIIFFPIAILSWFPFVSTFQTRLLFNQAFSRGLEISLILSGNKPNTQNMREK